MENKKTAVEWLVEQLRQFAFDPNHHLGLGDIRLTQGQIDELQEQAKQIEKYQIMQSYNDGKFAVITLSQNKSLEQYYNETYGGNK